MASASGAVGAQTPSRKHVRWVFDTASPAISSAPSSPASNTSSLAFINSQLVAHGFSRPGAIESLEKLGYDDQEGVVKCVLALLNQRIVSSDVLSQLLIPINHVGAGRHVSGGGSHFKTSNVELRSRAGDWVIEEREGRSP